MTLLTGWPTITDDTGNGTSGTIINNTNVWDVIKAAIEAVVHSATNPTLTPANIIDEVVTARGNEANLNARISGVIDADGNLVTQASLVAAADYQAALTARNLALNAYLNRWTNGGALAPDDFTLTGASATIARTGSGMADTFTFGTGKYAAKITRAGTDAKLTQTVVGSSDWTSYEKMEGQKVAVLVNVKTSVASHCRIVVSDGATETNSSYHTGGGTAEVLTALHTISSSATKLEFRVEVNNSNGDAYCGGFMFFVTKVLPTAWVNGALDYANAEYPGLVSIGAQDFEGIKNFKAHPTFEPGTQTTNTAKVAGRLDSKIVINTGSSTGGAVDLYSYTVKGGTLSVDGQVVSMFLRFNVAATGGTKRIDALWGANSITVFSSALGSSAENGWIVMHVIRLSATTQMQIVDCNGTVGTLQTTAYAACSETLANDIILLFRAPTAAANNDLVAGPGWVNVS